MNVKELRLILETVHDDVEIIVRAENEDGDSFCGGITSVGYETSCGDEDDVEFFAIDCMPEIDAS